MNTWLKKHNHAWALLYFPIYLVWFCYLEERPSEDCNLISSPLDAVIPFNEVFIVPYLLWFAFIAATVGYFFLEDRTGFLQLMGFLAGGMTIFLLISTVYPNGLALRPAVFPRENVFTDLVRALYAADTSTNVLPSIHVLNSLGAYSAIAHSERLSRRRGIRFGALVLTVLIILSTMFLKQHSVVDVLTACLLAGLLYGIVYGRETKRGHVTAAWETAKQ